MSAPVCLTCNAFMRIKRNGVYFITTYDNGTSPELVPYESRMADQWKCPFCGHEVLTGFGLPRLTSVEEVKRLAETDEVFIEQHQ